MTKDICLEFLMANIKATYYQAIQYSAIEDMGLTWYANANLEAVKLAKRYNVSLDSTCGIIAALSPNNRWERNLIDAESLLLAVTRQRPIHSFKCCTYNQNKLKAWQIANGEDPRFVLSGNKVTAFYQCILNPSDYSTVCIDSHAANIALGRFATVAATPALSDRDYANFARAYRRVTRWINIDGDRQVLPMQVQATTWVYYRAVRGIDSAIVA